MPSQRLEWDEVKKWESYDLDPREADQWIDAWGATMDLPAGTPLPGSGQERRRVLIGAIGYALNWKTEFGGNFWSAAPWLPHFEPLDGASAAAPWRDAGWGQSAGPSTHDSGSS